MNLIITADPGPVTWIRSFPYKDGQEFIGAYEVGEGENEVVKLTVGMGARTYLTGDQELFLSVRNEVISYDVVA